MEDILMPFIVRYKGAKQPKFIQVKINAIIKALDSKFIDDDPVYKNVFEGPEFPQENELAQIKTLCEVVRDNHCCIDPLDRSTDKFKEYEIKCDEVLPLVEKRFNDLG